MKEVIKERTRWFFDHLTELLLVAILGFVTYIASTVMAVKENQIINSTEIKTLIETVKKNSTAIEEIQMNRYRSEDANNDRKINELQRKILEIRVEQLEKKIN